MLDLQLVGFVDTTRVEVERKENLIILCILHGLYT